MNAREALEITKKVQGEVVIEHLLDGIFSKIRIAAANGENNIFGKLSDLGTDNERQTKALWEHFRSLGYSVIIYGRASNMVNICWEHANAVAESPHDSCKMT